jgi:hypothetical protein
MEEGHLQEHDGDTIPVPSVDWAVRFPELERLFATHLVESWSSLHASPAEALREGIDDRSIDELRAVLTELNDLRALQLGEPDLRDVLFYDLGSYYNPSTRTCTEWLEEVAVQLEEAVGARTADPPSASAVDEEP